MNAPCASRVLQSICRSAVHPFLRVRTTFRNSRPYAAHFHDCLSIGVLFDGETDLRRSGEGEPARIRAGQMVLLSPMEAHSCNPVAGRPRGYHMLCVDADWARGVPADSRLSAEKTILESPEQSPDSRAGASRPEPRPCRNGS